MKFKYVKEFEFPADRGFRGSNKMPSKVGKATGAPRMASMPKVGKGQGFAEGGSAESSLARFKAKAAALRSKPKVSKAINMELPGKGTAIDAALARGRDASYRGKAELAKLAALRQKMGVKPRPTPVVGKTKAQMAAQNAPKTGGGLTAQPLSVRGPEQVKTYSAPQPVSMSSPAKSDVVRRGRYGMRPVMEYAKGGSVKKLADGGSPLTRAQQNTPIRNMGRYVPRDYLVNPNRLSTLEESLAKAQIRKSEAATKAVQNKLAKDAAKSAALKTVGKVAARAIPGLGAALTAYDVGKYAYNKYQQNQARKKPTVTVEQVPDSGAPLTASRSGGGGGMGITSGGAMFRGMPTSSLPQKRGTVTVEETEDTGMRRGGSVKGKAKIGKVMREYKEGKLHSGSKKGPKVESRKQAVAIALSEARKAGAKIPKKAEGGIFNDEDMAYQSKGPKTRGTARKGRMEGRRERRAREAMERAEKYAPGLSLDMADKKKHGGMPVHRRKPMYGGGKC